MGGGLYSDDDDDDDDGDHGDVDDNGCGGYGPRRPILPLDRLSQYTAALTSLSVWSRQQDWVRRAGGRKGRPRRAEGGSVGGIPSGSGDREPEHRNLATELTEPMAPVQGCRATRRADPAWPTQVRSGAWVELMMTMVMVMVMMMMMMKMMMMMGIGVSGVLGKGWQAATGGMGG